MKKVRFFYFDAGGGHRSAATALKTVIEQQGRPWDAQLVNFQDLLEPLDILKKLTGLRIEDGYNLMLRKGWTLGSPQMLKGLQFVIRLYHKQQVRLLSEFFRQDRTDLAVSVIPHFNRALFEGLKQGHPEGKFVTILTDLANYPPHFWMEKQDQYIVCGTERAVEQARQVGYPEDRIFPTSGMILRPSFYQPVEVDRAAERERLGLDPDLPTGLVLFGGYGASVMLDIAARINRSGLRTQLILVCGRNQGLAAKLRSMSSRLPMFVEGFTSEIPYYMALSDYFIGKPGPGSISEALHMKLPVILECNDWTLPQERYNADWVTEKEVGVVLRSFRNIGDAVGRLLSGNTLETFRSNAAALHNRAVFEIPGILEEILLR